MHTHKNDELPFKKISNSLKIFTLRLMFIFEVFDRIIISGKRQVISKKVGQINFYSHSNDVKFSGIDTN